MGRDQNEQDTAADERTYEERMDRLFTAGRPWEHRTLRTLFDPLSHEWSQTTMDEKLNIVRRLIEAKESLWILVREYQSRYEATNPTAAHAAQDGLAELLAAAVDNER